MEEEEKKKEEGKLVYLDLKKSIYNEINKYNRNKILN